MNFQALYNHNRDSVEKVLTAMWCGEANNASQRSYIQQMKALIQQIFAPEQAVPVVQCMNLYKPVHSVAVDEAKKLVGGLWTCSYAPYEHQYKCWDALLNQTTPDGKPMSIVVTTGTGSGKTECFMLPLVHDLVQTAKANEIQAIFLYPLNALMEDQKERLEALLTGTNLTYTVYNGDLPEREPSAKDTSPEAQKMRRRIELLRGAQYDAHGKIIGYKFERLLYTREMVRKTPPNILLTNPTMLEYILLRGSDHNLFQPSLKSLRWVTIDETHTYTGAGAAELAMLLRRVLLAFNVKAQDIRFATSSATFGNAITPGQQAEEEKKLRNFISGITGVAAEQVVAVGGQRVGEEAISDNKYAELWKTICKKDYVSLDELFPGTASISEKLGMLEEMCQVEDSLGKSNVDKMKMKVHYFYRVPNNGLYIRLTEHKDGSFIIHSQNTLGAPGEDSIPMLELCRCKNCGEYIAIARHNTITHEYEPVMSDDSDMFDIIEEEQGKDPRQLVLLALSQEDNLKGDNNVILKVNGNTLEPVAADEVNPGEWHIVGNTQYCCPYCNAKQSSKRDEDGKEPDLQQNPESFHLQRFRVSSELVSRYLAPSILDQLEKDSSASKDRIILHDGQQYISFVDSRQNAAKATLNQNLEQERMWVYSTIFHELCRRKADQANAKTQIEALRKKQDADGISDDESDEIYEEIRKLKKRLKDGMTWMEIADLLRHDKYCPVFCENFIKRSRDSEELTESGDIAPIMIDKYVQSIMVMYLSRRPVSAAAPETMGLFQATYPKLKDIKELPEAVIRFNNALTAEEKKITLSEWHNLLQVFLDHTVRSNQSVFLHLPDDTPIDIFSTVRFATEIPHRRPAEKPQIDASAKIFPRTAWYLGALLANDETVASAQNAIKGNLDLVNAILEALWKDLTETTQIIEWGSFWDADSRCFVKDSHKAGMPEPYRMNLVNMNFKLYDDVYLCDVAGAGTDRIRMLRPIGNHFKNYSPYSANGIAKLDDKLHDTWEGYPYFRGNGTPPSLKLLRAWAQEKRPLLWQNNLWGEQGVFMNRLEDIYLFPNLFIQAEHTAQVDKEIARTLQSDFKEHSINILACSTTMEMGVDLGNLEVVMLSSVPPQPANYKQRAGRSGRNNRVRSACITLCGSDVVGLRTLYSPLEKIIFRPVEVPTVDIQSPQVVQRHVNSFLIRAFGVFTSGNKGGSLNQKVVDYYSPFVIVTNSASHRLEIMDENGQPISPSQALGDKSKTRCYDFSRKCESDTEIGKISGELELLLKDTCFDGQLSTVISNAKQENERCYTELAAKLDDYKFAYDHQIGPEKKYEKFRNKLKIQYLEALNERLLNFWATNRFTPNANMPVNVLSLDLNSGKKTEYYATTSSNPSYSLREAIAQYAPGNSIVVDGIVYIVRGIEYINMYQAVNTFKKIYRNASKTVIDNAAIPAKMRWGVNGREDLEFITPTAFSPDINEDYSRIVADSNYTHVSAQLIGTSDWSEVSTEANLFSVRNNKDTGDAKILYYNEGMGYGYCFCTRCGRMVIETEAASEAPIPDRLPPTMNDRFPKDPEKPKYHFAIGGRDIRKACAGSYDKNLIRRNVIIGGLLQTDYSEIRLRNKKSEKWIGTRDENEGLLYTLGIAFTQCLLDVLGKERGAVDFAITPNGHICIFDTNPGGSGYANQLIKIDLMKRVVAAAGNLLEDAKKRNSNDMLLDKFTVRYLRYIDVDAALNWIKAQGKC